MPKPSLSIALTLAVGGLVACAGGEADTRTAPVATGTSASPSPASSPGTGDAILIEERITDARLHTGVVLDTSVLGEAPFCKGGKSSGSSEGAVITETFSCPGGTLTVQFSPTQPSLVQGAPWVVVSGTGSFEGLRGGGSMVAVFDATSADSGRVVFAGTVSK